MSDFEIVIVDDEACPECGAMYGHENPAFDFPNRPKVDNAWKCYNPECEVAYYLPETGAVEYRLPPDEEAAMKERIKADVENMMKGKAFVRTDDGSRPGMETWELQ
jgi:hypothetical protein